MTAGPPAEAAKVQGTFTPLAHTLFRVLWIATVVGNVGTFMRDVASQWLVTGLSPSPAAVAVIQAAATLPVFLFAIPAGVLSDILDRRTFLIVVQVLLAAVSVALGLLAWSGTVTVTTLVLLTFLGGTGAALMLPTWQAIVPELVPGAELKGAVALNSMGINVARSLGPALGGLILAVAGAATTYAINVLTYLCVIAALIWWRRTAENAGELREHFGGAMRAGLRYAAASPDMHRILWRTVLFFAFGSAAWSLMPVVARHLLGGGPSFYGIMLGASGAGAIGGAVILPRLRDRLGADRLVLLASMVLAATTALLALVPVQAAAVAVTFVLGVAWIAVLVTLNATMQSVLPNWVRGRGLAMYLTAFNGAMATGALVWGAVAEAFGTSTALIAAGAGLALAAVLAHQRKLPGGESDLSPSMHWPEPAVAADMSRHRGPVLVTVEYTAATNRAAFAAAAHKLALERRRDGAHAWGLTEDSEDPERIVEWFLVASWAEHLRQHRRTTRAAADVQAEVNRFHTGPTPPQVRHLVGLPAEGGMTQPSIIPPSGGS